MNPGISGTKWLHNSRYSGDFKKKQKEFSILHLKKSVKNLLLQGNPQICKYLDIIGEKTVSKCLAWSK